MNRVGLMDDSARLTAAHRLITAALGPNAFDEQRVVFDAGIGYANGGSDYGMSDVWVTGNWNDIRRFGGQPNGDCLLKPVVDTTPGRLFDALERIGVNGEWYDQHERCADCYKLIETQPTHYGWLPQYIVTDDGDTVCRDCVMDCAETFIDEHYADHVGRAITWLSESELQGYGWRDAFPDERSAASGWHPGQNDKPADIVARWRETDEDAHSKRFVFIIVDKGQFDIHYRLYIRSNDEGIR